MLDTSEQGVEATQARQARLGILAWSGIVAVVMVGLFLRTWILGREPWSSATAIPALMARGILHGHFSAFYWGQNYGGVEPYAAAAMFVLFGQSNFTLGLTPVVLDAIAAVLVWRIGRRLFGARVGVGAALLFWIWPEVYIFDSTQEYGFRFITLVCGLAVMLIAIRIAQRSEPVRLPRSNSSATVEAPNQSAVVRHLDWLALGLFAGIGWWSSPEVAYYLVPAVAFLGWRLLKRRIEFRPGFLSLAVLGAVVGALPWLWANARSHLGSLRHVSGQPHGSYLSHLSIFFTHVVPIVVGLRLTADHDNVRQVFVPGSGGFLVGTSGPTWATLVGEIAYTAVLVGVLVWIVVLIRRKQALVLVGAALAFPFLYAYSPLSYSWQDGRYGLFLAPILSLLVVSGVQAAFRRFAKPRLAIPLTIMAGLALTLIAAPQLYPFTPVSSNASRTGWSSWNADPNPGPLRLVRSLEAAHLDHVWAGYYVALLLDWESRGEITASNVRYGSSPYYSAVATAKAPAWLFAQPGSAQSAGYALDTYSDLLNPTCLILLTGNCGDHVDPGGFEAFLAQHRIAYRVVHIGPMVAVQPTRPIPETVLSALHRSVPTDVAFGVSPFPGG
jgi:4-amino-4-deoxy-L-arabinose transferase-like glycosyltransferase